MDIRSARTTKSKGCYCKDKGKEREKERRKEKKINIHGNFQVHRLAVGNRPSSPPSGGCGLYILW